MNIQGDDKIKMKNCFSMQYILLDFGQKKGFWISYKSLFSLLLFIIILLIISFNLKNKNKTLLSRKSIDRNPNEKKFFEKLKYFLDNDEILENENLNKHTTFQLGGPAKFFTKPKSIKKIIKIIHLCKEFSINYFILGNGSNLLVSDKGFDGLVIKIHEDNFSDLKIQQIDDIHYKVSVGGGILMTTLSKRLCLLSLSGLEDIIDIPGTIGGGIIMNASSGGKGLIFDSLAKVKVITPDGEIKELIKKDCRLRRRGSFLKDNKFLVIEATFNLIKADKLIIQKVMTNHTSRRYLRQPKFFPNAGCFFVWNKQKFGSLYEKYKENNLVGYKVGEAMICTYNVPFIVNLGNATSSEVYEIVTYIEKIMKSKYNIDLIREVVVLGLF